MQYIVAFLEGIITFISPCLLPMLPVYVSYFASGGERKWQKTFINALGFVTGFTIVFILMGAFAGAIGGFLKNYQVVVNIVTGIVVVFFGLSFTGVFKLNVFKGIQSKIKLDNPGFFSTMVFGLAFSLGWTPCVGAFLGSALMLAGQQGSMAVGILMLLCYSLGLGIPFVLSAVLIDNLKGAFGFIKKHYDIINKVCGIVLIIIGVMMMTGIFGTLMGVLS